MPDRVKRRPLGRDVWLNAAKQALIEDGTAGIEINKLAKRIGVSRGGFYWFFRSRRQLLDELLAQWVRTGTAQFERLLLDGKGDGRREYRLLTDLWIDESEYNPKWDAAVRDWARTSATVRRAVQQVDRRRIAVIERICKHLGYKGMDAQVRARIIYYHQVGYYALGVLETRTRRIALVPYYRRVLIGLD